MSSDNTLLPTITFLVEGVMLVLVACVGLVGNILSFMVLSTQGLQKTFHNLLLLLNIFDMVSTSNIFDKVGTIIILFIQINKC